MCAVVIIPEIATQFEYARTQLPFLGPCQVEPGGRVGWYVTGTSATNLSVKLACYLQHPAPVQLSLHAINVETYVDRHRDEWPRIVASAGWQFFVDKLNVDERMPTVAQCVARIQQTLDTLCLDDSMDVSADDDNAMMMMTTTTDDNSYPY